MGTRTSYAKFLTEFDEIYVPKSNVPFESYATSGFLSYTSKTQNPKQIRFDARRGD
jgi:hypothetical protein